MNPSTAGIANMLGVKTQGRETVDVLDDLIDKFGKMPFFLAARFGDMLGIDSDTLYMLIKQQKEMAAAKADYSRRLKEAGIDTDELAKKSQAFTNAMNGLYTSIGLVADKTADKWLPAMTAVVEWLDSGAQAINKIGNQTDGWTSSILSLAAALGSLKAFSWLLSKFIPGMGRLAAVPSVAPILLAGAIYDVTESAMKTPEGKAYKATGDISKDLPAYIRAIKPTLKKWFGIEDDEPKPEGVQNLGGVKPVATQIIKYFESMGWSREAAVGIAANLQRESKFDPRAKGDEGQAIGIAQWHPDRQAAFKRFSSKDIGESTLEDQLRFVHHELTQGEDFLARRAGQLLKDARTATEAGALVSKLYERPKYADSEALLRGRLADQMFSSNLAPSPAQVAPAVAINQQTSITVNESTDPRRTAETVSGVQGRVNADLLRNTRGAVR
jgi:hypothetical protein